MLNIFMAPFAGSQELAKLRKDIREGVSPCSVFGVSDAAKAQLALLAAGDRPVLFLTSSQDRAAGVAADLETYAGRETICMPAREVLLGVSSQSRGLSYDGIAALQALVDGTRMVATDISALLYPLPKPEAFSGLRVVLKKGQEITTERLSTTCVRLGYTRVEQVEAAGQFALRGGIFDIFPVGFENPVRLEFFDTEIESIRVIDSTTQRSTGRLDGFALLSARYFCPDRAQAREAGQRIASAVKTQVRRLRNDPEAASSIAESFDDTAEALLDGDAAAFNDTLAPFLESTGTLLDYLPENTLVVLDEPRRLRERCENLHLEFVEVYKDLLEKGRALPQQGELARTADAVFATLHDHTLLCLQGITTTSKDISPRSVYTLAVRNMQSFQNKATMLAQELLSMKGKGYTTIICCQTRTRAKSLQNELSNYSVHINYTEDFALSPAKECAYIVPARLSHGFEYPELRVAFISESDIYTAVRHKTLRRARAKNGAAIDSFTELTAGDYVVHENNGIGIYQGIEKIVTDGIARDYITIAYQGTDRLFVPIEQLSMVQKFIGANEDIKPKLSRLGSKEWQATKSRVKKSIEDITDELIALYREREKSRGHAFSPDTPWQRQFEEDFLYTETPDQITSIDEIKADMEKPRVMDRLLCGDVGYGKTEVALRAAFKAVMDNMQVAILAPTTILAQQHYNTVVGRTASYGMRCEVLSRFRTPAEQSDIKKRLLKGEIDIIVGTHALLAKTVEFKNLGLLVIDEEQRFGVKHKERIKQLKNNIDVLTLTATPIPRTLHMSLIGVRDMSVIESPPQERYPVQTYVAEFNTVMVRDAILRELSRGGQVYYVYNRVQGIEGVAAELHALVPDARVAIGHGQMAQGELEKVMLDFYNGQYDILLCTTIIESGLDVPNVNTLIVADADNFGLSQLYQLRGRVGRSNRLAYAYFTFRRSKVLGEVAEKRLNALREFTEFGSGFKIAMRDLEIRGAGNLLGGEQSGHMQKVGYELYCKLIREAVSGQEQEVSTEVSAELKIEAYIDDSYVRSEAQKLLLYKRIAAIQTLQDKEELLEEITDRYGAPPPQVLFLLEIAYLRTLAAAARIHRIRQRDDAMVCFFEPGRQVDFARITQAIAEFPKRVALSAGGALALLINTKNLSDAAALNLACTVIRKINE